MSDAVQFFGGIFLVMVLVLAGFVSTILLCAVISMHYGAWGLAGLFALPFWATGILAFIFWWNEL